MDLLVLSLLLFFGVCAGQENSDAEACSTCSGGASIVDATARGSATTVYLPTNAVLHQFLNTTGMDPDSLVAVSSSYSVLQAESEGLAAITSPDTNVFASVLIVPGSTDNSVMSMINQSESNLRGELSGRTQLMYNCTSAPTLWNLLEDVNVLNLTSLQLFDNDATADKILNFRDGDKNLVEEQRDIVALISIQVADCLAMQKSSIGRPVLGNSFFGAIFDSSPTYFYSLSSTVLKANSSFEGMDQCVLQLEMARASLAEVYPDCKIKFHATDLNNFVGVYFRAK